MKKLTLAELETNTTSDQPGKPRDQEGLQNPFAKLQEGEESLPRLVPAATSLKAQTEGHEPENPPDPRSRPSKG